MGGLLMFLKVGLRFYEMCLEHCPDLFLLRLRSPGLAVFLEFTHFRDKTVGDADDFPLCDDISRRGRAIDALIQPHVEAFKWLVEIEGFLELPVIICQVRC